ncbi:TolC family protein [Pandoraea sputorum]|uniref:TolC family protein n=1 Tax=Pandoraea sputorum TaxID=93222 RepID=UPI001E3F858C|nr:TolC family protein [Pandoraea sputorum]MCE4063451.1 TolC family protein [Pandoraea sputorum]
MLSRPCRIVAGSTLLSAVLLGGCTMYRAVPLPTQPDAPSNVSRIPIDAATLRFPALAAHHFDPSDGLDSVEVAMLAVSNNPDLKLARDDLGIAHAQSYAAGLLPDPQVGISSDYVTPGGTNATRAFNYGVSMDLMAIASIPGAKAVAEHNVGKLDLGLLWQEQQIIAQARRLFAKVRMQDELLPLARQASELAQARYATYREAVSAGNLTSDNVSAALTSAQDTHKQYTDLQHADLQAHADLNALLGLSPETELTLIGGARDAAASDVALDEAVGHLAQRRADLLALAQGYAAQDAQYRQAILKQFPSLTVGFVRARDTSNVYTSGFQINLSLPIFNRNQGNVAIESATRNRLHDEYQIRLNQAYADIARLRADRAISRAQLGDVERALPGLSQVSNDATREFQARNLTLSAYTDSRLAWLAKSIEALSLREAVEEQDITIETLAGLAMVSESTPSKESHHESK